MAHFFRFDRIISYGAYYCEKRIILCLSDLTRVLTKTFMFNLCFFGCFFYPLSLGWWDKGWGGALPGRNRLCQRRLVWCGAGRTAGEERRSSSRHEVRHRGRGRGRGPALGTYCMTDSWWKSFRTMLYFSRPPHSHCDTHSLPKAFCIWDLQKVFFF